MKISLACAYSLLCLASVSQSLAFDEDGIVSKAEESDGSTLASDTMAPTAMFSESSNETTPITDESSAVETGTVPKTSPELGKEKSVEPIDTEQKEINIGVPNSVNEKTVAVAPAMVAPTSDANTESEHTDAKTVGSVNAVTPESIKLTTKPTMTSELEQEEKPTIDTIANLVNDEAKAIAPAGGAPIPGSSNVTEVKNTDANTNGSVGKETPESVDQTTTKGPTPEMVKEIETKDQTSNTPASDSKNIQHSSVTDSSNVNASEDSKKVADEASVSVPDNGSKFHVSLIVVGIAVSLVILLVLILVTVFLKKRGIRGADLLPC